MLQCLSHDKDCAYSVSWQLFHLIAFLKSRFFILFFSDFALLFADRLVYDTVLICSAQRGYTALMWAAEKGHTGICKLLFDQGADTDLITEVGFCAPPQASKQYLWDAVFVNYRFL